MVLVTSAFRDGESYVERYFAQIEELRRHLPVHLRIAEGDSTDDTYAAIEGYLQDGDELYQISHGGPAYGSIDHPLRWGQIAYVWNQLFDKMSPEGPLVLVEADLIWQPETILRLLADLDVVDAVAPLSLKDDRFYDTWGHRGTDGIMFTGLSPYHPSFGVDLATHPGAGPQGLVEINSAGSCIAMREDVYRVCRFGETDGIVGFGADIRRKGFQLFCNPTVSVTHP